METTWNGLEISGNILPFEPAITSGPVERCQPAEGGYAEDCSVLGLDEFEAFEEAFGENLSLFEIEYVRSTGEIPPATARKIEDQNQEEMSVAIYESAL